MKCRDQKVKRFVLQTAVVQLTVKELFPEQVKVQACWIALISTGTAGKDAFPSHCYSNHTDYYLG